MSSQLFEFNILNKSLQDKIHDRLLSSKIPFQSSQLYISSDKQKITDTEKRRSEYRTFTDPDLFDLCDDLIKQINEKQNTFTFKLVQNDVTEITYGLGGFFKPHKDYLSLTTNNVLEYTMIVCLSANCEGGETLFHFNPQFTHISQKSSTQYGVVLFRKDVVHEGVLLTSGHKKIMTLNLLGIPHHQEDILVINCLDTEDSPLVVSQSEVARFPNYFSSLLDYSESDKIVITSVDNTEEEMQTVYKVLTGQSLTMDEYKKHEHVLDYYAIPIQEIINIEGIYTPSSKPGIVPFNSNSSQYILFQDSYYTQYWLDKLGSKYIPFEIIYIEGKTLYVPQGRDETETIHNMEPVALSVSGKSIWSKTITTSNFKDEFNLTIYNNLHDNSVLNDVLEGNIDYEELGPLQTYADRDVIPCHCIDEHMRICNEKYSLEFSTLYGLICNENPSDTSLLYLEEMKELSLIHQECCVLHNIHKISKQIPINDIKINIAAQEVPFLFPQEDFSISHFFCNENMYGNATLITVHGLFKAN